jgi:hypothetical protein
MVIDLAIFTLGLWIGVVLCEKFEEWWDNR